jgi:hypothetical protein
VVAARGGHCGGGRGTGPDAGHSPASGVLLCKTPRMDGGRCGDRPPGGGQAPPAGTGPSAGDRPFGVDRLLGRDRLLGGDRPLPKNNQK